MPIVSRYHVGPAEVCARQMLDVATLHCPPQVAGTSGKVRLEGDDDAEGASTEQQGAAIREALGMETRNKACFTRQSRSCRTCSSLLIGSRSQHAVKV